jgi:signal transduction histidine kinase
MEELLPKLELKSLRFSNQISAKIKLNGVNHDLLFQLFYNLISNAIRYNKEYGAIIISENLAHSQPYCLSVKDTGIGIRREELGTIFNRFKKSGQDGEGYGLGLSIAKSIVVYHDSEIRVSSEYGTGSEFIVLFPSTLLD